jgi:hypothetical protein
MLGWRSLGRQKHNFHARACVRVANQQSLKRLRSDFVRNKTARPEQAESDPRSATNTTMGACSSTLWEDADSQLSDLERVAANIRCKQPPGRVKQIVLLGPWHSGFVSIF